ncbi:MAG: hypothetical protein GX633_09915 [Clostridiales bacterium]|nr:hypothetical protein [Clostridiales bacterium]
MIKIVPALTYQQYDADYSLPHPGEGYGGWKKGDIPIDTEHTAISVMHAWDNGTLKEQEAIYRVCEYIPRGAEIIKDRFPLFLEKVRESGIKLIHIGSLSEKSVMSLPGYIRTSELCPEEEKREVIEPDDTLRKLREIHTERVLYGHNTQGVAKARAVRDFAIMPRDDEDVACTTRQLFELCKRDRISHLIYTGFAINACLTMSPCGMLDMTRHGIMCSIIKELTTAVENKESCRREEHKEYGLWAFSLWGGYVFLQMDIEENLL